MTEKPSERAADGGDAIDIIARAIFPNAWREGGEAWRARHRARARRKAAAAVQALEDAGYELGNAPAECPAGIHYLDWLAYKQISTPPPRLFLGVAHAVGQDLLDARLPEGEDSVVSFERGTINGVVLRQD